MQEIERVAPDRRFVQVLMLAMGEMPLGRRHLLADLRGGREARAHRRHARRQHLPHRADRRRAGRPTRSRTTSRRSAAFENQLLSFIAEGVFQKFPGLKLVLIESGFTWLPTLLWRTNKTWRGVRPEVPWLDRLAGRHHSRARALHACSRSMRRERAEAAARSSSTSAPTNAAVLDRLSALAFRRRRRPAGRAARRNRAPRS